jgi:hypothetical protein
VLEAAKSEVPILFYIALRYIDGNYHSNYHRQTYGSEKEPYMGRICHKLLDMTKLIIGDIELAK